MEVFGFTYFSEFDDSDVGDLGNTNLENKNINVNIVNTTNNDLLDFDGDETSLVEFYFFYFLIGFTQTKVTLIIFFNNWVNKEKPKFSANGAFSPGRVVF